MNILIFGPNGSGKGTQGAVVQKRYGVPHIETGVIFRENINKGTELGNKAKEFIDRGELVPDGITVPMILDRLRQVDCKSGWLLDGFPRNLVQAEALWKALQEAGIEVRLERKLAEERQAEGVDRLDRDRCYALARTLPRNRRMNFFVFSDGDLTCVPCLLDGS